MVDILIDKVFHIRTLINGSTSELTIYVGDDGFIKKVSYGRELVSGYEVIDLCRGKLLTLPGFIDLHVHLRDFRFSYKEDIVSGSSAAASAGYVLVCDMPNTNPRIDNVEVLKMRVEEVLRKSYVDYGVYCGIPNDVSVVNELLSLKELFVGFKIYPEDLVDRFEVIKYLLGVYNGLVVVHGELPEHALRPSTRDLSLRYLDRPSWGELVVTKMLSSINKVSKIHITHSSHPSTPYLCRSLGFTVDTTPYYFLLSGDDVRDCWGKVNPPINNYISKTLIFNNLIYGVYDAVVSDHAPHSIEEKLVDWRLCPPGIADVEVCSRVLLTLFIKGFLSYELLIKYLCRGPAKVLGVDGVLGSLSSGFRASFTVVDLSREGVAYVRYSKARRSCLDGFKYVGEVVKTVVGGTVVFDDGVLVKPKVVVFGSRC